VTTPYHAKYFAHELTRHRSAGSIDRLSQSLFDAAVDLNPHQINAALFALANPLSKGVLLADEVGLGKTIEASLVLCQYWAERRRRLLVVCPASIRKQWSLELEEKFNLPTLVLDAPAYRQMQRGGILEPFLTPHIIITSFNFASRMQGELRAVPWDLVVIDEAHKLRNAYRASNKMGQRLRWALEDRQKLLLTATPLQNSLLELYGLSTLIGEHLFGDVTSFRERYMRADSDLGDLRGRLKGFAKRTLRQDVGEYIRYTERRALTTPFSPNDEEHRLYEALSAFLQREDTYALPSRQRQLTTLVLRKLLASSSHAVAGTLETILGRLQGLHSAHLAEQEVTEPDLLETLLIEEEAPDEYADAALEDDDTTPDPPQADLEKLEQEIAEVTGYLAWARSIAVDSKSRALLTALQLGFGEFVKVGANRKALIFTESRRTQAYLKDFLEANGHAGKVVLFNGSNTGPETKAIFERWLRENAGSGRATGSRDIDSRTAIIEHFRDHADILIATEAAAEGVNMQFCSLVVNYDLPWNPQRVEQRIGRCHRYGQLHDVVVINFLNQRNEADRRVLELLSEKFRLFNGVFGASDEVLGTLESGVDFEKRILAIYQECRTTGEIESAFQALQKELEASIEARLRTTRRALLEHFDEDVHERLKVQLSEAQAQLGRVERLFWSLSQVALADHARFDEDQFSFELISPPRPTIQRGHYTLVSKRDKNGVSGDFLYRFSHPLGEYAVETAKAAATPLAELHFDVTRHPTRLAAVEALTGHSGWLTLTRLVVETFATEDYLLFNGFTDDAIPLD
jgi:SNF2 family DNA or RNA helicase